MSPFDLTGKVAIITGGSRGIGLAAATALARAGANVVIAARKPEPLELAATQIREQIALHGPLGSFRAGAQVLGLVAHTGDDAAVTELVDKTVSAFGGVDILVNNAATNPHFGPLLSSDDSHWDKTWDVNVKGYFRMARACVPHMSARGAGRIVNIASVAGRRVQPGMGIYCVSKAAVVMLTQVLAVELAEQKINVNALTPGFVKTKFSSAIWANDGISQAVLRAIPQHRMAMPEEIANMILFLASSESSFVTGSIIDIDGGQLAASGIG